MNRRSLLQALGLAAVAPMLPTIPVADAEPVVDPYVVLAAEMRDPLYAIAFVEGPRGERYRYPMPATLHRAGQGRIVVDFVASFTGTVRSVEIARGDVNLVTLYRETFDTPHFISGSLVRVTISTDSNPSEAV